MFIDEARQILEARSAARQPLLEAWQETRLRFLAGRLPAVDMARAQSALRRADADPVLLEQVQEALLSPLDDAALEARLLALFQELTEAQGDPGVHARQDELRVALEERWLRHAPLVYGRALSRRELEHVLAASRLQEERAPAWEALCAPGRDGAGELLEWLTLEEQAARTAGWVGTLERRALRLGLDAERPRRWLDELRAALGPAIRAAADARLARTAAALGRPLEALGSTTLGALYPAEAPGRDGLPVGPALHALSHKDPLELVQDVAELLGLDVKAPLERWVLETSQLPHFLQGLVAGPEGTWPVVLLELRGDPWASRRALSCLGEALGRQATAVLLAEREEETGPACSLRELQALTLGRLLADLPGARESSARLLEDVNPDAAEWWREQELLELGQELLRVDWLSRLPETTTPGALWLSLRHEWLGMPERREDEELWAVDPFLGLRSSESLPRLAARILAAGLQARWKALVPEATPEWGGLLLESLTEPDDPELWDECGERLLEALDPAALVEVLGGRTALGPDLAMPEDAAEADEITDPRLTD